jgi:hypothetical protein
MGWSNARFFQVIFLASFVTGAADGGESKSLPKSLPKSPSVSSEPTDCYLMVGAIDTEMTVGLAVDLCGGTKDAKATVTCYALAFGNKESGGLGLNRGLSVSLCRSAGGTNR